MTKKKKKKKKKKVCHSDLYFTIHCLPYILNIWCINIIFHIMDQYDLKFVFRINVGEGHGHREKKLIKFLVKVFRGKERFR